MTVDFLIERLKELPKDAELVVHYGKADCLVPVIDSILRPVDSKYVYAFTGRDVKDHVCIEIELRG